MVRIPRPDAVIDAPERALRTTADPTPRHRALIALMARRGPPHPQDDADTGTGRRPVPRWLNADTGGGLDRPRPRKAKGAAPELTEGLAPTPRQWVIDGPAGQGPDRADWTCEQWAEHLCRARGIRGRKSAPQVFCRRHEVRPYRPTCRLPRGDPQERAAARQERAALEEGRMRASGCR